MSGWVWMLRRYGPSLTWRYWRAGQRYGWIKTRVEHERFLQHMLDKGAINAMEYGALWDTVPARLSAAAPGEEGET